MPKTAKRKVEIDWPETLELALDGIAQGGEGIGRWQGCVVFARGGLPGERVRVRLRERHAAFARGDVVDVLESSPDRVPPRLPAGDWMPWQHIAYTAQLRFKRQILADQLAKIGGFAGLPVEETLPAPDQWGYRSSARFHSDGVRVGYYAAESHIIQEVAADPLLLPALNDALAALRAALSIGATPPFEAILRVSETYGYIAAALSQAGRSEGYGTGDQPSGVDALRSLAARWRAEYPALAGVAIGSRPPIVLGASHVIEECGGIAFRLHPTTFFQVNRASAETLLRLTREGLALQGAEAARESRIRLLDLYCGAGAFALPLAAVAADVVGSEEHAAAVEDARATAAENGIANARFEIGLVERVLERLEAPFDAAVLDPPRRGCHPRALAALLRIAPARMVYISCQPATLARDLKALVAGGYRVARVQPVDQFPQTPHIESVAVLVRGPADAS